MSIKATKVKAIPGISEKVPCRRCGREIVNRPDRPRRYCGSCVSVLRTDGHEYFKNLVQPPVLEYTPRNVKGTNQHSSKN